MSISSNILNNDSRNLLRDEEEEEDEEHGENKSLIFDDDHEEEVFSTNSVRVLLVDSDPNSLLAMNNLLTNFSYQVTSYKNGEEAMSFLKTSKDEIDLVIWDYHMPTINGLEALNTIVKEIDLPVVITSHDHKIETVKKSILCGAYDFLVKPLSKEVVAVLWRHVYRKRIMSKPAVDSNSAESDPEYVDEEGSKNSLELNTCDQNGDKSSSKKPRMQWTEELHKYFLKAIEKLGSIENAVPKQILKTMQEDYGVKGLTRNNVASHLQKHRQNAMKKPNVQQETGEEHHWNNAGPSVSLTPSQPLQNPSLELDTRALYSLNGPNQYFPSRNLTMNNVNNNFFMTNHPLPMPQPAPYIDPFYPRHEQLQQQEYPYSSAQLPSMMPKQEPAGLLRPMEARDLDLIYDAETLPCDPEFFSAEINNLDFKSNSR